LAFLADDVPAFGSARFHISQAKPYYPANSVSVRDGLLENGFVRARIDSKTWNIVELSLSGKANLVDNNAGQAVNQYLFLEGKDVANLQTSGSVRVSVEEDGPLVASLRIESGAWLQQPCPKNKT
jgi:alpha-mannosidase